MRRSGVLSLALAGLASAQTWSLCNPVEGEDCPPNPAFGGNKNYDFAGASKIGDLESFFLVDGGVKYDKDGKQMTFDPETGLKMSIYEEKHAPTLTSKNYIFFGKVEVELQAAPGQGIVTSIVLQSDALDEIDWEFVGGDTSHVQTNFFRLGIEDYSYGREHKLDFNAMTSFHTYTFEWTPDALIFSIDGKVVRTHTPEEGAFPETPMQLKLGTWVGGKGEEQGTIDWAGGLAQWDQAPFAGYYRSVKVSDYGGGYRAPKEYVYTKGEGTWESIQVKGGSKAGFPGDDGFNPVDQNEDGSHSSSEAPSSTSSLSSSSAEKTSSISLSSSTPAQNATTSTTSTVTTPTTTVTSPTSTPTQDESEDGDDEDGEGSAAPHMQMSVLVMGAALFAGMLMW